MAVSGGWSRGRSGELVGKLADNRYDGRGGRGRVHRGSAAQRAARSAGADVRRAVT